MPHIFTNLASNGSGMQNLFLKISVGRQCHVGENGTEDSPSPNRLSFKSNNQHCEWGLYTKNPWRLNHYASLWVDSRARWLQQHTWHPSHVHSLDNIRLLRSCSLCTMNQPEKDNIKEFKAFQSQHSTGSNYTNSCMNNKQTIQFRWPTSQVDVRVNKASKVQGQYK